MPSAEERVKNQLAKALETPIGGGQVQQPSYIKKAGDDQTKPAS